MVLVVVGVAQPGSPFTTKLPGAWIFGVPGPGAGGAGHELLGIALVYGGLVVVLSAWYRIVRDVTFAPSAGKGSLRGLSGILALWVAPLLVAPPLFSRDVYTYGAEGELVARGINPYTHGLESLGRSRFLALADPLWRRAHAPYGPVFFDIARVNAHVSSTVFATLEGYRLVAILGVVLMAVSVPVLARSFDRDPAPALALAVLNPLVLLYLIGGMHNDAIMLGLLVAGVALARRGHPAVGVVVCAVGAAVKVPCLLGVVFIGWDWAGTGASPRRRVGHVGASLSVALAAMAVVSAASGLGWAWLWNLSDPGNVTTWLDPATAVGLAISRVVHVAGGAAHTQGLVVATRAAALVVAGVIVCVLVLRTDRYGMPRALGWSLLAVVFLGPIVWPWYETWGIVFLALAVDAWSRRVVLVLSALACFATVPAHVTAGPADVVEASAGLAVVGAAAVLWLAHTRGVAGATSDPSREGPVRVPAPGADEQSPPSS